MEFYRDDLVFKNTYNYEPNKKNINNDVVENNVEKDKKSHTGLKILIATLILSLTGPSIGRSISHTIQKSDKSYELEERDKMYDNLVKLLKDMRISNSIMAVKYISNLINDGYFRIENKVDTYYSITDEYDYDSIIGNNTSKSNSEIITKIINQLFDNVEAYTVSVGLKDKTIENDKKIYDDYMTLIVDKDLKVNYLYWQGIDKCINISSMAGFSDKTSAGNINYIAEYFTGNIDIIDFVGYCNNMNEDFSNISFDIYQDKADKLYNLTSDKIYDVNKLNKTNKYRIEYKEKNNRIPE